jgi:hypothetical protein
MQEGHRHLLNLLSLALAFSVMMNAFTYFLQGWWRSETGRDSVAHLEAATEKGGVFSIV